MKNLISIITCTFILAFLTTSCSDDMAVPLSDSDREIQIAIAESDRSSHRNCGLSHKMEELLKDPDYKRNHQEKFRKLALMESRPALRSACSSPTLIPVAVHFQGVSGANASCLSALAQSQIDILNRDYAGTNADISKWRNSASSYFPGISNGEACLKFVLATKNHPSGYGLSEGSVAVTVNKTQGSEISAFSGYLNIFVQPNLGFLGESPLGGSGNGDGVLIDANAFGAGAGCGNVSAQSPYDLGRTLTHEVGHYLLLDHIWGNGCGLDDEVQDTPNQDDSYGGCPSLGAKTCNSTDMHMNYMDYTDDQCMYMFSAGQATRMENYLNSSLTNLINNASNVLGVGNSNDNNGGSNDNTDDTDDSGNDNSDDTNDTNDTEDDDNNDDNTNEDSALCETPSDSQIEIINSSKVRVSWTEMISAIRYKIRYREQGTSRWTSKNSNVANKVLRNLIAGADYEYQISTRCDYGWTAFSNIMVFNTQTDSNEEGGSADTNCSSFKLAITLDYYGSETSWELVDQDFNVVAVGGPYQDGQEGKVIEEEFCISQGCYTLFVDDQYGDGICCEYGNGSFALSNTGGALVASSNGRFGSFDNIDFCVEEGVGSLRSRKTSPKSKKLARKKGYVKN